MPRAHAAAERGFPRLVYRSDTLGAVGFIVRTEVEVIGVNGRRVSFAVAAFDEREKIAEGTHERYVIDRSRFLANLEEKQT